MIGDYVMNTDDNQIDSSKIIATGVKVKNIKAYVSGTKFSIEDVHDSQWEYEIAYQVNEMKYYGITYQYIHWAPRFVMKYFDELYKNGGEIEIRIVEDNPSLYDASMDYAIAMELGPGYQGHDECYDVKVEDVLEISNCAEVKIIGTFNDESHFTRTIFKLLALGYNKFIFNIQGIVNTGFLISGAIGWARRYARAFTCDNKYALLKRMDQDIEANICRVVSERRDEMIEKFINNYMTDEEKKAMEYEKLSDSEKEIFRTNEMKEYYRTYKDGVEFAEATMMSSIPVIDKEMMDYARKALKMESDLTKEAEDVYKRLLEYEKIDIEELKRKLKEELIEQWNKIMNTDEEKI